jgi:uncharacterized protein YkwD
MKTFFLAFPLLLLLSGPDSQLDQTNKICVSEEEMKLYDLIMEYRKSKGLESIPLSGKLTQVAQTHAQDLANNYSFDPENKCNPHSWSTKGTWTSCCYTSDHKQARCMWQKPKEIADYPGNGFEIAYYSSLGASAQEAIDGWKTSPGHNPLMVNTENWAAVKWKGIGVGIYKEYGVVWFGEVKDKVSVESCNFAEAN